MPEERSKAYFSYTGGQKKTSFNSSVALVFDFSSTLCETQNQEDLILFSFLIKKIVYI